MTDGIVFAYYNQSKLISPPIGVGIL